MEQPQSAVDESDSAFPYEFTDKSNSEFDGEQIVSLGMSMRDYFAARALQGMLSSSQMVGLVGQMANEAGIADRASVMASTAYDFADAMLKVRER